MGKYIAILILFLPLTLTCFGQDSFVGVCMKNESETPELVALERAKAAALENGKQYVSTFTTNTNENGKEYFREEVYVESTGVVFPITKNIIETSDRVTVTITADVYEVEIPNTFDVLDIKKCQYTEEVPLEFHIDSYTTNYLNAFWFDEYTGDGGLLFMTVLTKGQKRDFRNYDCWKTIFPELLTQRERENIYFRDLKTIVPERPRVGGEKRIKVIFVATTKPLKPPVDVTDELSFKQWWLKIPPDQRQRPVVEHLTFLM